MVKRSLCILFSFIIVTVWHSSAEARKGVYDWAFVRLDYARKEKATQLKQFCERIHNLAVQAAGDTAVISFFNINDQYTQALKKGPVPEALTQKIAELRENFNRYYLENYLAFYDFLFVNHRGEVFYSIRKESDLKQNLFAQDSLANPLAECLRKRPGQEMYVDFHDYGPTAKPAAFFVEPVKGNGRTAGWIVLQCGVNKVNTIFAWNDTLGQTGETFLVNHEGFMLTESNFAGNSTILKKRLDDRNIKAKFADKAGHRTVTDYRGRTALTSFEVVPFMTSLWLVVAKVDRDEIVTRYYDQYRRYYADKLMQFLKSSPAPTSRPDTASFDMDGLRVDMDEFVKAGRGDVLQTFGISTCTGVLVAYPEKKFAYMAHISPRDTVYGANQTNLLGQMIKQLKSFDIRPCEIHAVQVTVTAPHLDTLLAIINKLVEEEFLLSQIHVLYYPGAVSAAMRYDIGSADLRVAWRVQGNAKDTCEICNQSLSASHNIGEVVREIVQKEESRS